jgi:hypothetical protein
MSSGRCLSAVLPKRNVMEMHAIGFACKTASVVGALYPLQLFGANECGFS